MKRRTLLASAAVLPLAACVAGAPLTPAQAVSDAGLIANGVAQILPLLGGVTNLTSAQLTAITSAASTVQVASAALSTSLTTTQSMPLVSQIAGGLNAIVGVLANMTFPSAIATLLSAANVLLPLIEAAVGISVPTSAALTKMTPDQARAVLKPSH